jgi:hypothetical protein
MMDRVYDFDHNIQITSGPTILYQIALMMVERSGC